MSQHDYVIENASGATLRADLNAALEAVATTNKGTARPGTAYPGQLWVDENTPTATVWTLNLFDGTDDIPLGTFDTAANVFSPAIATPAADTNTAQAATTAFVLGQVATQAEVEAGTGATRFVTPGRQHFHPSAAKFWVLFNGMGVPAIAASYNVTSITDLGTGQYRVNFLVPFSSAGYAVVGWSQDNGSAAGSAVTMGAATRVAGSVDVIAYTPSTGALSDTASVNVVGYGDQ